jgi:hypothetical protein
VSQHHEIFQVQVVGVPIRLNSVDIVGL